MILHSVGFGLVLIFRYDVDKTVVEDYAGSARALPIYSQHIDHGSGERTSRSWSIRNEFKPPKRIYFGFTPLKDDSLAQEESKVNPETTTNLKRDAQFNIFKAFKPIRLAY